MLIFGGFAKPLGETTRATDDGGSYDPVSDTWTPLVPGGTPGRRVDHQAIWTGSQMIVWGGDPELLGALGTDMPAGCIYQP